jgi:ATP-dependent protease Clp ATPase subunit
MSKINKVDIPAPWYSDDYVPEYVEGHSVQEFLDLSPKDIYKMLKKRIVQQDEACKGVALMAYMHVHNLPEITLLVGPSGCGKTEICRALSDILPGIVRIKDVSNMSQDGWSGTNKPIKLLEGIGSQDRCIICCDEFDKMISPKYSHGNNVALDIQGELLSILSGIKLTVQSGDSKIEVDTAKQSFLLAGSFSKHVSDTVENSGGFGFESKRITAYDQDLTLSDIARAGATPEICGRISSIYNLHKIPPETYREILRNHNSGPLYEIEHRFGMTINLSEGKVKEIAEKAYESQLGIRSIKNQLRGIITDRIWEDTSCKLIEL